MSLRKNRGLKIVSAVIAALSVIVCAGLFVPRFILDQPEKVLLSRDFPLQSGDTPNGRQVTYSHKGMQCGGGYVYALQSRIFSNSNDIEFWCRIGDLNMKFEPLPDALPGVTRTSLANIDGRLYDFQANSSYDFEHGKWEKADYGEVPYPYVIQPTTQGRYIFSYERPDCQGMSVYRDGLYKGTIDTKTFSAVAVWDNAIYVNTGFSTLTAPVPTGVTSNCRYLKTAVFDKNNKYAYGIFKDQDGSIVIGGAQGGYGKKSDSCLPPLVKFDGGTEREISSTYNDPDCPMGQIKEYYSYAPLENGVLIGNFPVATLLMMKDGKLSKTKFGAPQKLDWQDPLGTNYRESQAVVNAYGTTFIGMYPWGEIFAIDRQSDKTETYRLFQSPERDSSPSPYFWPSHNRSKHDPSVTFDPSAELVYSLSHGSSSLREEGKEPTYWGQRVPSVVVLSGRLCASTGSLSGAPFDPVKHIDLNEKQASEYGKVYCSNLPNHVMVSSPRGKMATFTVTEHHLQIVIDGKVVATARHDLPRTYFE